MKLRHPTLIRLVAVLCAVLLRWWLGTLRTHAHVLDERNHPADPLVCRFIYAFWHEALLAPACMKVPVHVLISHHADGELIVQTCQQLGIGVVRGSTSRGGSQALLEMLKRIERSHIAITPDGPRGPRREVQLGTVFLASIADVSIVPIGVGFVKAWRFGSWDRFALPVPYSTVVGVVGCPIDVPAGLDRDGLNRYRLQLQREMLRLTSAAEAWAAEIARKSQFPSAGCERPADGTRWRRRGSNWSCGSNWPHCHQTAP